MSKNKFILNADDFGMSSANNVAVKDGYEYGILKSTSLTANGEAFDEAVKQIIPACSELGVGVHLNVIEGHALVDEQRELTDANGKFNNSYGKLILKSYSYGNNEFMSQLEKEFRAQIERISEAGVKITHIDSHVHTHAIPPIFDLVCRLAKEYHINQIRTQHEKFYMVPDILIHLSPKYLVNLIKIGLLDIFTFQNRRTAEKYGLNTNDYLIGVGYTSMMNSLTVGCGLSALQDRKRITAEALIHPCRYEDGKIDNHFTEYRITQNEKLKTEISMNSPRYDFKPKLYNRNIKSTKNNNRNIKIEDRLINLGKLRDQKILRKITEQKLYEEKKSNDLSLTKGKNKKTE